MVEFMAEVCRSGADLADGQIWRCQGALQLRVEHALGQRGNVPSAGHLT